MHLLVCSETTSSEKSLFGERRESASLGTILIGKYSHNTTFTTLLQCDLYSIFSILNASIPMQMVNDTIFVIAMETDFILF